MRAAESCSRASRSIVEASGASALASTTIGPGGIAGIANVTRLGPQIHRHATDESRRRVWSNR